MGTILRHWRVIATSLFAVLLVGGSYVLAHGITKPQVAQASTETALLQAIATKDSNGDGLPDWEKILYGINPNATTTDYFHLGMTDGEAVSKGLIVPVAIANMNNASSSTGASLSDTALGQAPASGTLTAAFAENFLTLYLAAKQANNGADLSQTDITNISNEALSQLSSAITAAPDFKSMQNLTIASSSSTVALTSFAASAEAVFTVNTSSATTSEIDYLQQAVQNNDPHALLYITSIAKAYRDTAVGLSALAVPPTLATQDLALINALARMSEVTSDFTSVNSDPLTTMLALQEYPDVVQQLGDAFIAISQAYTGAGIVLSPETPGASFVNLIPNVAASQQGSSTQAQ
jgi:hypothetical protein